MGGAYEGAERRRITSPSLDDVMAGVGRIAAHLESETRFRDWVHEKFHDIKDTLFGNGKKGLVREMDGVTARVEVLEKSFEKMDDMIRKVAGWAITSCVAAICLIVFQLVVMALERKVHP